MTDTMAQRLSRLSSVDLTRRYQDMCDASERHRKMADDFACHAQTFAEALAIKHGETS